MLNIPVTSFDPILYGHALNLRRHSGSRAGQGYSAIPARTGLRMLCPICSNEVALETANSDENGTAVHGDCYLLKLKLKHASSENDEQTGQPRSAGTSSNLEKHGDS
jgi:hypothetical protein